jgi:hypothetical protein
MSDHRNIRHLEAFGIFSCGMIACAIVGVLFMARLEVVPSAGAITPMSYESLVTIMLAVATLVVGIVLPLAALFGFVLLRHDVRYKAEAVIKNEIEQGRFQKQVDDAIVPLLKNAETVLNARINEIIAEARKSKSASPNIDWGVEESEFGELPPVERRKSASTKRRKRT